MCYTKLRTQKFFNGPRKCLVKKSDKVLCVYACSMQSRLNLCAVAQFFGYANLKITLTLEVPMSKLICERPYFALILTYPSYGGPLPRIKYKCESACSALDLLLVNERGRKGREP
jgi:hypothetical protein